MAAPQCEMPCKAPAWRQGRPWHARYILKANLWIAIFSFVGNYWSAAHKALQFLAPARARLIVCALSGPFNSMLQPNSGTRTTFIEC